MGKLKSFLRMVLRKITTNEHVPYGYKKIPEDYGVIKRINADPQTVMKIYINLNGLVEISSSGEWIILTKEQAASFGHEMVKLSGHILEEKEKRSNKTPLLDKWFR